MDNKYLIDANVFIQAKNLYYRFDFCEGFWEWVTHAHAAGLVFSINKVKKEILNGHDDDPAKIWVNKLPNSFFLQDDTDTGVMKSYGGIMQWASSSTHYTPQAKAEFAKPTVADAFLLAVARTHGYKIVTQEVSNPNTKNKILIPDAAITIGVKTIFVYDMLSKSAHSTFQLKN